ncbi:Pyruvate/Phosphoenolpyruvate kinase-like domain-containing protein [Naematelia encephala]|uniref:Pyruvate/Phosphoenolpyruvate kinase-like domain-containing protein n=1 Tax=Naematelia encephala TaxID=71784 RepID=A0A1Y2B033_9TREE|nr:Pyruvate/Phosphoenolpyruvate kinase-like domain-containing protein [Naematelia encephala]
MTHTNGNSDGLSAARKAIIPNRLKDNIEQGKLAHSFSLKLIANIEVVHYAAVSGYDAVLIDLEHGSFGLDITNQLSCAALQAGICPIVRVPANTSDWISRALDGGAQAVIVPHVQNAAEAENVVRCAKFAPIGERSATGGMPILRYANIPAKYGNQVCNEGTTVICMVESVRAVEQAESIAAVPGVDMILVGHGDLTQDMGIPGEFDDPRVGEAFAKVCAAAEKASKNGRLVSVGIGGLHGRPDLIEKLGKKHPNARFAMSGADSVFLLSAMASGAAISQRITQSLST